MRHLGPALLLLVALAACDVEPASDRSLDTTAMADVGADLLAPDTANPAGCPSAEPTPNGTCQGADTCSYGQECCCGACSASLVCTCAGATWACYSTDFCMRPACDDASAADATDASWSDTSEAPADTGSPDGTVGGDTGDDTSAACPGAAPLGVQDGGCQTGQRCEYGQECCCGACAPSLVCECYGGAWGCHNTDFCMIPGCPDDPPPEGQCRDQADCDPMAWCHDADQPMPCGICRHPEVTCQADAECEAGWVCEAVEPPNLCLCEATSLCQPACGAEAPCPPHQACTAGHCGPKACAADSDCPDFYGCSASNGTCTRLPCTLDADCGPGHCVNDRCFADFGACQLPVP